MNFGKLSGFQPILDSENPDIEVKTKYKQHRQTKSSATYMTDILVSYKFNDKKQLNIMIDKHDTMMLKQYMQNIY